MFSDTARPHTLCEKPGLGHKGQAALPDPVVFKHLMCLATAHVYSHAMATDVKCVSKPSMEDAKLLV